MQITNLLTRPMYLPGINVYSKTKSVCVSLVWSGIFFPVMDNWKKCFS